MRGFFAAAMAVLSASSAFAATYSERDLGTGPAEVSAIVQFADRDAVRFNYAYTPVAGDPFTGLELLRAIQAATAGTSLPFTVDVASASFGEYVNGMSYAGDTGAGFVAPDGYWHYWVRESESADWGYSAVGADTRVLLPGSQDGWTFFDGAPAVPEPAALALIGLAGAGLLRRRRALAAAGVAALAAVPAAQAAVGVSVVPGSFTQGSVRASMGAGTSYANPAANLSDTPRDTGGFGGTTFPLSITNPNFNTSSANPTVLTFGTGGGVTVQFAEPVRALAGAKEVGVFTAQAYNAGTGGSFNGNMEAAVLVSADNVTWRTLAGETVANPLTHTAASIKLNAPTLSYDFGTTATAWDYGLGTPAANLATLTPADYAKPMLDDSLFNGTGTSADRLALSGDSSTTTYDALFGDSAGGNWIDISGAGLSEIRYLRFNGVNVAAGDGVRLDAVFANAAAVPEPAALAVVGIGAMALLRRSRR